MIFESAEALDARLLLSVLISPLLLLLVHGF